MDKFENKDTWFLPELRRSLGDEEIDFASVEAILQRRIGECEQLGLLGLLRAEKISSLQSIERVERDLFSQIYQYSEYDEPVNECLKYDADLTEKEWKHITRKLGERLQAVVGRPLWEQQLLAPGDEPTVGHWEAIESVLFDRITRSDEQLKENWVRVETNEEPVTVSSLETAEELLDEHIDKAASKPVWEQVLHSDEILSYSRWEKMEDGLFSRLDDADVMPVKKQPFWYIIEHYSSFVRGVGITGALAVLAVLAASGISYYRQVQNSLPTLVYLLEGQAAERYNISESLEGSYSMIDGGSATLVNSHGTIELQNNSVLNIEKLTRRSARYRVDFPSVKNAGAPRKVAFNVRPHTKKQGFSVCTPDYRIEVTGTYFRIEADPAGKSVTRVLEGTVTLADGPFDDTVLHAGQYLQFDPSVQEYRVFTGGPVLPGAGLNQLPMVEELRHYKAVTIRASVSNAHVHIDGVYYGAAPIVLRQAEGSHRLRVSRNGYVSVETVLSVSRSDSDIMVTAFLEKRGRKRQRMKQPEALVRNSVLKNRRETGKRRSSGKKEVMASKKSARLEPGFYREAQRAERSGNWRKAVKLYRKVVNNPNVTPLRHEDALFSIGKLQAEHERNVEVAKETFLTYLAMFPSGTFAGETWLRLAELEFRKNPEAAIQYYLKYFRLFPRHPRIAELQDRVGVMYLQQKQYEKAVSMFEQALANLNSSDANDRSNIAVHLHRALVAAGELQRAESVKVRYLTTMEILQD